MFSVFAVIIRALPPPNDIALIEAVGAPYAAIVLVFSVLYRPVALSVLAAAIVAADLGFNPQSDGRVVRINVPPLSTDVRKKMVARIKELCEEAKIAVRSVRRDGNKSAEQAAKDKVIGEDQRDDLKDQIQELTRKYEELANSAAKSRESDVMDD